MKNLAAVAVLSLAFTLPAAAQGAGEPLSIKSGDKTHAFTVEIADTPEEIATGLASRASVAAGQGLLLDMRKAPDGVLLNLKGVQVNLDLLYVGADGTIAAIVHNARAGSLRPLAPGLRSAVVIEIAGGQAAALGLKPGDKVTHKAFGNAG